MTAQVTRSTLSGHAGETATLSDDCLAAARVSVVVPVFNSQDTLPELVNQLRQVLHAHFSWFELLLINDGSHDGSWAVICQLATAHSQLHGINLMRNYGQHNALMAGIRAAQGDIVVTIDDDLQHPPEAVPALIAKLSEGYDVVYGTPDIDRHGLWRTAASVVTKLALQSTMGATTARKVSAFRAFRRPLREAFASYNAPFVSIDVLLTWATTRFAALPVRHNERHSGTSNYTLRMLIRHALNMITGFSVIPLQVASIVGFSSTLLGLLILGYVMVVYLLQGSSVPGFPFLASIIAIFAGAQLFALGIIGEYLARMHFRVMDKPAYVVRDVTATAASAKTDDRPR